MKRKRRELNLSRAMLAARAQVNPKTIALLEEGRKDIRFSTFLKVAFALGEPPEELVRGLGLAPSYREKERGAGALVSCEVRPTRVAKTDKKLLELLEAHGGELTATAPQIAAMIGCSERAFWDAVRRQVQACRLEVERRQGRGKSDSYRLCLTDDGGDHIG